MDPSAIDLLFLLLFFRNHSTHLASSYVAERDLLRRVIMHSLHRSRLATLALAWRSLVSRLRNTIRRRKRVIRIIGPPYIVGGRKVRRD